MNRRALLKALLLAPLVASTRVRARSNDHGTIAKIYGEPPDATSLQRVFAAGPPAAVLACVLAPDKLLGWPMQLSDAARRLLPPAAAERPHLGRLSGRGSTMSTESLLALRPDLVLDAGSVNPLHLSGAERVWQQTHLP